VRHVFLPDFEFPRNSKNIVIGWQRRMIIGLVEGAAVTGGTWKLFTIILILLNSETLLKFTYSLIKIAL
jgi:hypothetical protein